MKKTIIFKEKKTSEKKPYLSLDKLYFLVAYDDYSAEETTSSFYRKENMARVIDRTFLYDSLDDDIELDIYFESNMMTNQELKEQIVEIGYTNLTLSIKPLDEAPNKKIVDRVRAKVKYIEEIKDIFLFVDTFRGSRRLHEEQILSD